MIFMFLQNIYGNYRKPAVDSVSLLRKQTLENISNNTYIKETATRRNTHANLLFQHITSREVSKEESKRKFKEIAKKDS